MIMRRRRRRKGDVPFNPFNQKEVDKRMSEKSKEHKKRQKVVEERAKRMEEVEAEIAERRRIEQEEREQRRKLAKLEREREELERENKWYRSPSLDPTFYNDLNEKKFSKLSGYEKLIIILIHGLRGNPEAYNELGLFINYLEANIDNEKGKKKELMDFIRFRATFNPDYIQGMDESPFARTWKEKLRPVEDIVTYHQKNCPIKGITPEPPMMGDSETCRVCEAATKAIELLTKAKYVK